YHSTEERVFDLALGETPACAIFSVLLNHPGWVSRAIRQKRTRGSLPSCCGLRALRGCCPAETRPPTSGGPGMTVHRTRIIRDTVCRGEVTHFLAGQRPDRGPVDFRQLVERERDVVPARRAGVPGLALGILPGTVEHAGVGVEGGRSEVGESGAAVRF